MDKAQFLLFYIYKTAQLAAKLTFIVIRPIDVKLCMVLLKFPIIYFTYEYFGELYLCYI